MKNVKLTLATTLSVLAMAFSGVVSADNGGAYGSYKQNYKLKNVTKSVKTKVVNRKTVKHSALSNAQKHRLAKRVIVKKAPKRSVVFTKRFISKKPVVTKYVSNKLFNQTKNEHKGVISKNRYKSNKQYQRYDRVNAKRVAKNAVYSVRSGDTLIQVAFKTGVSVSRLAKLNRINHTNLNHLKIGQVLRLI